MIRRRRPTEPAGSPLQQVFSNSAALVCCCILTFAIGCTRSDERSRSAPENSVAAASSQAAAVEPSKGESSASDAKSEAGSASVAQSPSRPRTFEEAKNTPEFRRTIQAERLYRNGFAYERKKDTAAALQLYTQALKIDPRNLLCSLRKSALERKLGRAEEALDTIESALAERPTTRELLREKARVLEVAGRRDEAIATLSSIVERATELEKKVAEEKYLLAIYHMRSGDYASARTSILAAIDDGWGSHTRLVEALQGDLSPLANDAQVGEALARLRVEQDEHEKRMKEFQDSLTPEDIQRAVDAQKAVADSLEKQKSS